MQLYVFLGGGFGALCRFFVGRLCEYFSFASAFSTVFVNLAGCFFIGLLFTVFKNNNCPAFLNAFFITGFLGGFTTFSTFTLDALQYMRGGDVSVAVLYVALQVVFGLVLAWLGVRVGIFIS